MHEKLNALRSKHELTYQQLADMSNVPVGTVKSILTGATGSPGFEPVCAMLMAMGESIDEFCGLDVERPQEAPEKGEAAAPPVVEEHHHHFSFMPFHGDVKKLTQDAISDVYAGEAYRIVHSNLKWWRAVALVLIVLVVGWFTWDITHPDVGLIQYGSAMPAVTSGMLEHASIRL